MNMFQVMPLNQLIFHLTNITNIYCNLSLFKYLDTESKKNIGGHHKMGIKVGHVHVHIHSFQL